VLVLDEPTNHLDFETVEALGAALAEFEGTVVFVAPLVDKETRTATVRLLLPNTSQRLRPGMFARVEFDVTVAKRTLLVPREALLDTGSRQVVFVAVGEGRYEPREVRAGATGDQGEVDIRAQEVLARAADDPVAFVERKRVLEHRGDDVGVAALLRARCIMLERERATDWAIQYAKGIA